MAIFAAMNDTLTPFGPPTATASDATAGRVEHSALRLPLPTECAAFTGHRSYRREADDALLRTIAALRAEGVHTFLNGMAAGFDLAAAEAVLACRADDPTIRLIAALPFPDQAKRFPAQVRRRYEAVLAAADGEIVLCDRFHKGSYLKRDNWLVGHAATLVTWYDGSAGGTRYTIRQAHLCGRRLIHLHPHTPRELQPLPELFG